MRVDCLTDGHRIELPRVSRGGIGLHEKLRLCRILRRKQDGDDQSKQSSEKQGVEDEFPPSTPPIQKVAKGQVCCPLRYPARQTGRFRRGRHRWAKRSIEELIRFRFLHVAPVRCRQPCRPVLSKPALPRELRSANRLSSSTRR